jgi:hypothetical protein
LLLSSADLNLSDKEFREETDRVYKFLEMWRDTQKKDFKKWEEFRRRFDIFYGLTVKRDSLGITLSIDQTSEDQQ